MAFNAIQWGCHEIRLFLRYNWPSVCFVSIYYFAFIILRQVLTYAGYIQVRYGVRVTFTLVVLIKEVNVRNFENPLFIKFFPLFYLANSKTPILV